MTGCIDANHLKLSETALPLRVSRYLFTLEMEFQPGFAYEDEPDAEEHVRVRPNPARATPFRRTNTMTAAERLHAETIRMAQAAGDSLGLQGE
jgi:hypothetical protein